jgi:hypothetical protein
MFHMARTVSVSAKPESKPQNENEELDTRDESVCLLLRVNDSLVNKTQKQCPVVFYYTFHSGLAPLFPKERR